MTQETKTKHTELKISHVGYFASLKTKTFKDIQAIIMKDKVDKFIFIQFDS